MLLGRLGGLRRRLRRARGRRWLLRTLLRRFLGRRVLSRQGTHPLLRGRRGSPLTRHPPAEMGRGSRRWRLRRRWLPPKGRVKLKLLPNLGSRSGFVALVRELIRFRGGCGGFVSSQAPAS